MINVTNVDVQSPTARFTDPFAFDISFECIGELKEDLEWNLAYVGSAESDRFDQKLESILVGPIPVGNNKFTFQAPPPDPDKIPPNDVVGITVILLTCTYRGLEFVRIGYYVNNEYDTQELRDNSPERPIPARLMRSILADKARVTRFPIPWDETPVEGVPFPAAASLPPPQQQQQQRQQQQPQQQHAVEVTGDGSMSF